MESPLNGSAGNVFFVKTMHQDRVHLKIQCFGLENCLYHDSDGTLWVCCGNCLKCCHLCCLNPNLHPDNFKQVLFQYHCQK